MEKPHFSIDQTLNTFGTTKDFLKFLARVTKISYKNTTISLKLGLHQNANAACENEAIVQCRRVTDARQIAFGYATSIRQTAERYPYCRYLKGNLHTIRLYMVDSLPGRMPNSVQMYHMYCLASCPHMSFVFAFGCKHGLTIFLNISFKFLRNFLKFPTELLTNFLKSSRKIS